MAVAAPDTATKYPIRINDKGEARAARENVGYFLAQFERDPEYVAAWAAFRAKLEDLERTGELTRSQVIELDETAFWAVVVASHVVADRFYDGLARTFFPLAIAVEEASAEAEETPSA